MSDRTIALTGAAGTVGRYLRKELADLGTLRLLDVRPDTPEFELIDLRDIDTATEAFDGCDVVVHLAGLPSESSFEQQINMNIRTAAAVFEAARLAGVPRVVWASSGHVTGYLLTSELAGPGSVPRPDSFYGVAKVAGEALASLYADKYGLTTISVRLGHLIDRPAAVSDLPCWLSPGDAGRLFRACITGPASGHVIVYGCSDNPHRYFDLTTAKQLGYVPQDNSEDFADEVYPDGAWRFQGGEFTDY